VADRVHGRVQLAMLECAPCEALTVSLLGLRATMVESVESIFVTAEGRLMLGRARVELAQPTIDRWRSACGLKRTRRGWEGLPARQRAPTPRKRNAPFGISPPARA